MDIFFQAGHSAIDNWKITLIDQVEDNLQYLRQKNPFSVAKVWLFYIQLQRERRSCKILKLNIVRNFIRPYYSARVFSSRVGGLRLVVMDATVCCYNTSGHGKPLSYKGLRQVGLISFWISVNYKTGLWIQESRFHLKVLLLNCIMLFQTRTLKIISIQPTS